MSDRPPPLTPGARAIVDAARGGDEPGAGDRERVRAKVLAALAAGGAAGAGAAGEAGAATSSGGATAGGALATKLAVIALAVVGVATGAYLALRSPSEPAPSATPEVSALPPEPEPEPEVAPAIPGDAAIEIAPEDVPAPAPRPRAKKKEALSPADSLREERALIARASDALRDGDAAAALAAIKDHQRRFPDGLLIEERSAARVQALCALGRTADGTSAREAFLARWPRSVHAARVRAACAR